MSIKIDFFNVLHYELLNSKANIGFVKWIRIPVATYILIGSHPSYIDKVKSRIHKLEIKNKKKNIYIYIYIYI